MDASNLRPLPALLFATLLGTGCAMQQTPVPLQGTPEAIRQLEGTWEGEYISPDGGVLASISFALEAGTEMATGDIVVLRSWNTDALNAGTGVGALDGPPLPLLLQIELVRCQGRTGHARALPGSRVRLSGLHGLRRRPGRRPDHRTLPDVAQRRDPEHAPRGGELEDHPDDDNALRPGPGSRQIVTPVTLGMFSAGSLWNPRTRRTWWPDSASPSLRATSRANLTGSSRRPDSTCTGTTPQSRLIRPHATGLADAARTGGAGHAGPRSTPSR